MKITEAWIKKWMPCKEGLEWFKSQKETDGVKVVKKLIKQKKLNWASWGIVRLMTHKQQIRYAIFAAECVLDIYEKRYPKDDRPRKAIETAKVYLKKPTEKNRNAANAANAEMKLKILNYGIKLISKE